MSFPPEVVIAGLVAVGGLFAYGTNLLFTTGRLLGRVEERLDAHDRRLEVLEDRPLDRS